MPVDPRFTDIGSRRELFVDQQLVEHATPGLSFRLNQPVSRNAVIEFDKAWEGNKCAHFATVLKDGDTYRLYYLAWHVKIDMDAEKPTLDNTWLGIGLIESNDGISWHRPNLGLVEFEGSKENNLVFDGHESNDSIRFTHGFTPFIDNNPDCPPQERYKAVGAHRRSSKNALRALVSPDGLNWTLLDEPVAEAVGENKFDSQNLGFWDGEAGLYRAYFRIQRQREGKRWWRDNVMITSKDFRNWSTPVPVGYQGAAYEELYTNGVLPYERAPHQLVAIPARYIERKSSPATDALPDVEHRQLRSQLNDRYGAAVTDSIFMASRDGVTFKRYDEAFLRPGPQSTGNWTYGDNYVTRGFTTTASDREHAPNELSLYAVEGQWLGNSCTLRRFSMRQDGFVSATAPHSGGELLTRPIIFDGKCLRLNMSTSAAGSIRVGIEHWHREPIEGFTLAQCDEVIGDDLDRVVTWNGSSDVSTLAGKPLRVRFELHDADLYSYRFVPV